MERYYSILKEKGVFRNRRASERKEKILNQIHSNLSQYSCTSITIQECLAKTSCMTVELFSFYSKYRMPRSVFEKVLLMVQNYFVILHMDIYTGYNTIDRNHIFRQATILSDRVAVEMAGQYPDSGFVSTLFGSGRYSWNAVDRNGLKERSHHFLNELVQVYYNRGLGACLDQLADSVSAEISQFDKSGSMDREVIEEIIRSVQAEKFFNPAEQQLHPA